MTLDPRHVKLLFNAALDLPNPADRSAFLDGECGDDRVLRLRLDELFAAYDRPADALESPLAALSPKPDETTEGALSGLGPGGTVSKEPDAPPASLIGTVVAGRYKLREEIGEGGMGRVFLVEQLRPVKRLVALKLIKAGMDSKTVLARFESERQALALMDHPNIAKVLDAGSTESGLPFFVMDLVKGIPVTDYCDRHRLALPERLALFRQICSAVQHAHQKGIIHRDLKPSNILVESHDDKPVPKVIDFGLAKATSGRPLTEKSLFTAFGSVAGTPLYMAPEQASFNALDIDTRTDIYALGVILYELLTGSTPIRRETFQKAALDEMLRVIREVEPPTPSSRLSTSDTLPSLAANRHIEPSRLSRFVRGDLDWIVMKALAKERHRRYDSAIGLADDIRRFTNHEPVVAGPPSSSYRLRKFVRKYRGRVVAASLVLLALVVGVIGTSFGLVEADRQRKFAITRQKLAETRLGQRDKSNQILLSIFHELKAEDAENVDLPLANRLGKRLDLAATELEGETVDDPTGVARMQAALGESMIGLGDSRKAIPLLTKALETFTDRLGPDDPETIACMTRLARACNNDGKPDRALPLFETALSRSKAKLGPDDRRTIGVTADLAECLQDSGRPDRSIPLFEEALDRALKTLGPHDDETLSMMNNLGNCYRDAGQSGRAIPLLERCLALRKSVMGPDNLLTLTTMNNLALAYRFSWEIKRAVPLHEEVLTRSRVKLGADHPTTIRRLGNLAEIYRIDGQVGRSAPLFEETHALMKARVGPDHPDTLISMGDLANVYQDLGDDDRALGIFEDAYRRAKATLAPDHPIRLTCAADAAECYLLTGHPDQALPLFREISERRRRKDGQPTPILAGSLVQLGRAHLALKDWAKAEPCLREAVAIREEMAPNDWRLFSSKSMLGAALLGQRRYAEAEPLLRSGYAGLKACEEDIPPFSIPRLLEAMDRLITLAEETGKVDEVKALKEEQAKLPRPPTRGKTP